MGRTCAHPTLLRPPSSSNGRTAPVGKSEAGALQPRKLFHRGAILHGCTAAEGLAGRWKRLVIFDQQFILHFHASRMGSSAILLPATMESSDSDPEARSAAPRVFATTHWSVVLAAGQGDTAPAQRALE